MIDTQEDLGDWEDYPEENGEPVTEKIIQGNYLEILFLNTTAFINQIRNWGK